MNPLRRYLPQALAGALVVAASAVVPSSVQAQSSVARYDHIIVIVEENHGFSDVIGDPAAPNLNHLAQQFGLATDYFGITHPSEPNYVALLGGSFFGLQSDDPYFMQTIDKPSLISQLDGAGISWKAYLQGLPYPGYQGYCYPVRCNGAPDTDPLYVSKHDAIQNFTTSRNARDWARQVPIEQLSDDLASGNVPAFDYVIPTECSDEHGDPPYCLDSGNPGDPQDQHLVASGDAYLGGLVSKITNASFWAKGNNAVAVVYDEGDDNAGCCDASAAPAGGGQVASVVITSHGPRAIRDSTPYNHFSLLQTIQRSFGLGCLEFTCDTANVKPLAPLFVVTGSAAVSTSPIAVPDYPTPTPTPVEPVSYTTHTDSANGWHAVPTPLLGTGDNSFGAVAAAAPNDVWAVGNFASDTASSNQDATLSLAAHFDGTRWSSVPTPNAGPNFDTLYGVAAAAGQAWAVGVDLNDSFQSRALIETWSGKQWSIVDNPQPGSRRDLLWSVSADSAADVWAVGTQQGDNGKFETLVEHWDGSSWSVVPSPDPGTSGNQLHAVTAINPDDVWAVGQQLDGSSPDQALIEHWNGWAWTVVSSPTHGSASAALYGVAAGDGKVWAVGELDDSNLGASALVETYDSGVWSDVSLPRAGSIWTTLWNVTASDGKVWAVGTFVDPVSDSNQVLMLRHDAGGWSVVGAPNPGSGSNLFGGIAAAGDTLWAVGIFDDGGSRETLVERHTES